MKKNRKSEVEARVRQKAELIEIAQRYQAANRLRHQTPAVQVVQDQLEKLGVLYKREKIILIFRKYGPRRFFLADFHLPRKNTILEIDGGYHIDRTEYDLARDTLIQEHRGLKIVRIPNEVVLAPDFDLKFYL